MQAVRLLEATRPRQLEFLKMTLMSLLCLICRRRRFAASKGGLLR